MLLRISLLFVAILIFSSCKKNEETKIIPEVEVIQVYEAPIVTNLSDLPDSLLPKTTLISDMPPARTIAIPTKERDFSYINSNDKKIDLKLVPPTITPLAVLADNKGVAIVDSSDKNFTMGNGGISNFTNFTTNDGLALDGVSCSVMDRKGNLWFGTQGGGVSRYDGYTFTTYTTAQGLGNNSVICGSGRTVVG
jgi:hypothetical protein